MIKDLGLSRLGLWDQRVGQDIEDILADFLEFELDLLTVLANDANVLVVFGLLLLLNGRDDSPRGTSSTDDVLVCDRQQVALVDRELAGQLGLFSLA